jgi:tRNA pseudouridine32 synthase/23S rRNA pseudouridine746 synthase
MSYSSARFETHLPVTESGQTAVALLAEQTGLSRQRIKAVMRQGAVWLTTGKRAQRLRRASRELSPGQTLHLYYDEKVLNQVPVEVELIADKGHYSVWNKPCGMLSQGSKWGDHCTVTRWAEQHLRPERNAFVVHRLDRAANGLIIVAHEKQAAAKLSGLFQTRHIDKRYRIWVVGEFPSRATAEQPIKVTQSLDDREACSYFNRLHYDDVHNQTLIDVKIDTGRKHQIRRHVAGLGYPVVGDRLYGETETEQNLQLTAYYLAFTCPFSGLEQEFDLRRGELTNLTLRE